MSRRTRQPLVIYTTYLATGGVLFTTDILFPTPHPKWRKHRSVALPPTCPGVFPDGTKRKSKDDEEAELDESMRWLVGLDEEVEP